MSEKTKQKEKSDTSSNSEQETTKQSEENDAPKNLEEKKEALTKSMDDLLDEIDGVLEENAEEFVKNYIQRGGE